MVRRVIFLKEYKKPDLYKTCFEGSEIITLSASGFCILPDGEVSLVFKDG